MRRPIHSQWAAECAVRFMKCLRSKIEGLTDDDVVIRDTMEGATDVDPVMEKLIGLRQEAKAMAESRKALAAAYADAARADAARQEKIEQLMFDCLKACGQDKWTGVAGTASLRVGSWSTDVVDPAKVPLQYQKAVPDVAKIKEELSALRLELEAMSDVDLIEAAVKEGLKDVGFGSHVHGNSRRMLIDLVLKTRVPGAALIQGEDTIAIRLPSKKKEAA